jgi:hypothetical protein
VERDIGYQEQVLELRIDIGDGGWLNCRSPDSSPSLCRVSGR